MINKPKILFMGAGVFAVPVLDAIAHSKNLELAGTVTQPDKAAGRKRILTPTPLGKWADANGIPCERAVSVNTPEFLNKVQQIAPDLIVVVSFGQLLKQPLLESAPFGCLNVHASLLPRYRGASPIVSAVLNGDPETGIAFMRMEKGLDTGPVYEMHRYPVSPDMNAEELEQALSNLAAARIENCILKVVQNQIVPQTQSQDGVVLSKKIRKSDGSVRWQEDAEVLERKIRAYHNWPSMSFCVNLKKGCIKVKIMKAKATTFSAPNAIPGKVAAYANNQLMVACGKGALMIERVLPEGKKEMAVADFLNGSRIAVGDILLNGPDCTGE